MMHRLPITLLVVVACGDGFADPSREFGPEVQVDGPPHATRVDVPSTLGVADTHLTDVRGQPIGVRCATCHGPTPESSWVARDDAPSPFHESVEIRHGGLSCTSCHDAEDQTLLHLADGTTLEFFDAMRLCGQCHGPQLRDYQHGAHGGMTGYWDLRRGGRDRNHCVTCHAPHAPKYQQVRPVFPPRDRYLEVHAETGGEAH
jgi:hypothetical protein